MGTDGRHGETPADLAEGEALQDRRKAETERSAEVLGVQKVYWLGYHDSGMTGWPQNKEPNSFIGDGKTLWHYNELLEQVSLYDAKKEVNRTPFVLLTSNDASLWQQYEVTGAGQQFVITPKSADNPVRQLTLTFSGVGLSHMAVLDNNGQRSDFEFLAIQNNVNIENSLFKFEAPAGVEVDDLRNK